MKEKEPGIAGVLNIIPGLGYLYVGTKKLFATLLLISVVLGVATMFDPALAEYAETELEAEPTVWESFAVISFMAIWVAFVIDGYQEAKRFNREAKGKKAKK